MLETSLKRNEKRKKFKYGIARTKEKKKNRRKIDILLRRMSIDDITYT